MWEAIQITLVIMIIVPTLALVGKATYLYSRHRKEKAAARRRTQCALTNTPKGTGPMPTATAILIPMTLLALLGTAVYLGIRNRTADAEHQPRQPRVILTPGVHSPPGTQPAAPPHQETNHEESKTRAT